MKNVFNKKKIIPEHYVNVLTGESLADEKKEITSVNYKNEDLVILDSKEYVVIDSKAFQYIQKNFTPVEVGRITKMADMVKGCFNLLHDKESNPHTKDTLMQELDYTRNIFAEFMKKLYKKSVIYYMSGMKNGKDVTYIMLNPTLARKNKAFHRDCVSVFDDLTKRM